MNHDGKLRGMTFHCSPYPAILSISTILKCVDMYMKFR
uniref:Uncharacterized protein n=1 Tax=Arundo donax TaxID=35708 RepID=A0A0A9HT22_ARUDO